MPPYFCAKTASVSGAISSWCFFVPTEHRIPSQSNALGHMPGTLPRSEGTPPISEWQTYTRSTRMRRSFRTHEGGHTETQGVALGWYASPLQGESKCRNSGSPRQGESKYPNSRSPRHGEIGFSRAGVCRPLRRKHGPHVESLATIRSMDVVVPLKRGERVMDMRMRTAWPSLTRT
jgi:hypothetical protein